MELERIPYLYGRSAQMVVNHILIRSDQYPTKDDPVFAFIEQTVIALIKLGVRVTVVAPQSLTKHFLRNVPLHPRYRKIQNENGVVLEIFQPYMITLGNRFPLVNSFFEKISLWSALKRVNSIPQVCYGHFWHCAVSLYNYACKKRIPLFVASGEASIKNETKVRDAKLKRFLDYYSGVFFASSKNMKESELLGFLTNQKRIVLPNAIDPSHFYSKNKKELRAKYHIAQDVFIVVFVGGFIDRKGPNRVAAALKKINNPRIKAFFIGREHDGVKFDFDYAGTLFKGVVPHEDLIDYLNMADVFVLPTLAEGCCNAIIEAMACGLPIISSNCDFNDDILDDSCSIRVNPNSIDDVAMAIKTLYDDSNLLKQLEIGALKKASLLTIDKRASAIIKFIKESVGENR